MAGFKRKVAYFWSDKDLKLELKLHLRKWWQKHTKKMNKKRAKEREKDGKNVKSDEITAERSRKMANKPKKKKMKSRYTSYFRCTFLFVFCYCFSLSTGADDSCFFHESWKLKYVRVGVFAWISVQMNECERATFLGAMWSENCVSKYLQNSSVLSRWVLLYEWMSAFSWLVSLLGKKKNRISNNNTSNENKRMGLKQQQKIGWIQTSRQSYAIYEYAHSPQVRKRANNSKRGSK